MALGDIATDAVLAAVQIDRDRPGTAVAGDSSGGWSRIRAPHATLRQAVDTCNAPARRPRTSRNWNPGGRPLGKPSARAGWGSVADQALAVT